MEPLREIPCVVCGARVVAVRTREIFTCSAFCRAFVRRVEAEQAHRQPAMNLLGVRARQRRNG